MVLLISWLKKVAGQKDVKLGLVLLLCVLTLASYMSG